MDSLRTERNNRQIKSYSYSRQLEGSDEVRSSNALNTQLEGSDEIRRSNVLKSYYNIVVVLLMFVEPISNILASFIDLGRHLFDSFLHWVQAYLESFGQYGRQVHICKRRVRSRDLKSLEFLGQGFSGFIYETTWSTWYGKRKLGRFARKDFPGVESEVFEHEAAQLMNLHHPNVVKAFCWTVDRLSCSLVLEFVSNDLQSVVEKATRRKVKSLRHGPFDPRTPFKIIEAIYIMLHIARAMEYLHSKGVAHGDLRPNNVLVDLKADPMIVKVVDFGLIESKKRTTLVSNRAQFLQTLEWKAPETFNDFPASHEYLCEEMDGVKGELTVANEQADVYSFAIMCSYILGGTISYPKSNLTELQHNISSGTLRPVIPDTCPMHLRELIRRSWDSNSARRPRFLELLKNLELQYTTLVEGASSGIDQDTQKTTTTTEVSARVGSHSTSGDLKPVSINSLPDELLKSVFRWLSHVDDSLRARAVCKRWRTILTSLDYVTQFRFDRSSSTVQSFCPLVFKRTDVQHEWCGFDSTKKSWQRLPPLVRLPQVDIRPLTGNGKVLIGYKITAAPSQVVVGNPVTSTWLTIPNSTETWGEVGNILLVDHDDSTKFQIIAVREEATEIFHSHLWTWTQLRERPAKGVHEKTVLYLKDKLISATPCGGLVFCYGVQSDSRGDTAILVSFDVQHERWTDDCIPIPSHASSPAAYKCFQMVECAGHLFAVIEDATTSTIAVWGLGLRRRQFVGPMVEMPQPLYVRLCMGRQGSKPLQLKAVGHQHRMFFWRNLSNSPTLCIVVFDFLLRIWDVLPDYASAIGCAPSDAPDDLPQIFVDTGSFETYATFDVFLNHQGSEKFVGYLMEELVVSAGLHPFLDAKSLVKGEDAFEFIDQALEEVQVHVAIISKRYVESEWCLNELLAMFESGKPIIPIFYEVEPRDLYSALHPSAPAFEKHVRKGRLNEVKKWANALQKLSVIIGFRSSAFTGDEVKLRNAIVKEIQRLMPTNKSLRIKKYQVDLEGTTRERVKENPLNIFGMGGMGKTTLRSQLERKQKNIVSTRKI